MKVYAVLKPDGKAIILEFVPNEDRVRQKIPFWRMEQSIVYGMKEFGYKQNFNA